MSVCADADGIEHRREGESEKEWQDKASEREDRLSPLLSAAASSPLVSASQNAFFLSHSLASPPAAAAETDLQRDVRPFLWLSLGSHCLCVYYVFLPFSLTL